MQSDIVVTIRGSSLQRINSIAAKGEHIMEFSDVNVEAKVKLSTKSPTVTPTSSIPTVLILKPDSPKVSNTTKTPTSESS